LGIAQAFEGIGAQENAATGEEYTVLYARFLPEHLEKALDVMGDMVLRPTFADLEREREVNRRGDQDVRGPAGPDGRRVPLGPDLPRRPPGQPIIGSAETVRGVDHETLKSFHQNTYTASNVFVVGAGKLDPTSSRRWSRRSSAACRRASRSAGTRAPAPRRAASTTSSRRPSSTTSPWALGHPREQRGPLRDGRAQQRVRRGDEQPALQEVREKRGLAYAVYSYHQGYSDAGAAKMYVGSTTGNVEEAVKVIAEQLDVIREEPVGEEELHRTREQLKSSTILALESTAARMTRIGRSLITGAELLTPEEIAARIDAVTAEDLQRLANDHLKLENMYLSAVGPRSWPSGGT
jgi:predicted Zn-dependent peptidase